MSDLKKDIKNVINNSLKGVLKESYVTQPKKFDLKTEALSEKVKLARQADFEVYVKTLNEVSAQLDTVGRD